METKKRTEQEINQDYTNFCVELGDTEVKIGSLQFKKNEILKKMSVLARELNEVNSETQAQGVQ